MKTIRLFSLLLVVSTATCAVEVGHERSAVAQSLLPATLTPVPCYVDSSGAVTLDWGTNNSGTISDLLFADALAECDAAVPDAPVNNALAYGDLYMKRIVSMMGTALTPYYAYLKQNNINFTESTIPEWTAMRSNPAWACDQTTGQPTNQAVTLTPTPIPIYVPDPDPSETARDVALVANNDLRLAPLNLCVAQQLRQLSPGSTGSEALLFSASEQRQLLENIRERSQMAMLQYALLGEVFAANVPEGSSVQYQDDVGYLSQWAQSASTATLTSMGTDFATAVQLNETVAEEMSQLLARSRNADPSAVSPTATPAAQAWGYASWQDRDLAMMFGGDPLVTSATGSWPQAVGTAFPGTFTMSDWPSLPYVSTYVESPQVWQLWSMAQAANVAQLQLSVNVTQLKCYSANVAATATGIYDSVEAQTRFDQCYPPTAQGTCPAYTAAVAPPYLLQTEYGITPDHATTLASLLADEAFTPYCVSLGLGGVGSPNTPVFTGALDLAGQDQSGGNTETLSGNTITFSPNAGLVSRGVSETGALYAALAPLRFPTTTEVAQYGQNADSGSFALGGACSYNNTGCSGVYVNDADEAKRTLGALQATTATRDMVLDAMSYLAAHAGGELNPSSRLQSTYFATGAQLVQALTGAAGTDGVKVVPQEVLSTATNPPILTTPNPSSVAGPWIVTVTHAADDAWWTSGGAKFTVLALRGANAANLAAHPEAMWNGSSLTTLVQAAESGGLVAALDTTTTASQQAVGDEARAIFLPLHLTAAGSYTLVAQKSVAGAPSTNGGGATTSYRLLAGNVSMGTTNRFYGQELAFSGTLGTWIGHQSQVLPSNPTKAAYDGFDQATDWVPPFSAEILGGNPGDSIVATYLNLASTAASNATTAAETALDNLLQEEQDVASEQAAEQSSELEVQQEADALCGAGNTTCVTTGQYYALSAFGYPAIVQGDPSQNASLEDQLYAQVYALVEPFYNQQVWVADPVAQALIAAGGVQAPGLQVPTFANYGGGSLQQAYIAQWNALVAPVAIINTLEDSVVSANAAWAAVSEDNAAVTSSMSFECGPGGMAAAVAAGFSVGVGGGPSGATAGVGFSGATVYGQVQSCNAAANAQIQVVGSLFTTWDNSVEALASSMVGFSNYASAILASGASTQATVLQAASATAKAQLEGTLAVQTNETSFGLYREYRDYDLWRAKALMENARMYALAARRAVEAQYVVDLSQMTQPETFVAAPSTWADEVYMYDLSLPSSVGLSVSSSTSGTGIYVNQVQDYVTNLQGFVNGYAVSRPSAVAQSDLDVVSLAGLDPGTPIVAGEAIAYPALGNWLLHCPGDGATVAPQWVPTPYASGNPDQACASVGGPAHPDMAQLNFELDPWGRAYGAIGEPPFVERYNARWTQLALNFVGTGIKNCVLAADPPSCYASEWIPYNMTHAAPAWVTDYDEIWHEIDVPVGQIEAAKGLAAEIWLDPLQDGWSTQYVGAIARTEFELRPLGGTYTIQFPVGPEVVLGNIQRVQLLVGSSAWVKQQ